MSIAHNLARTGSDETRPLTGWVMPHLTFFPAADFEEIFTFPPQFHPQCHIWIKSKWKMICYRTFSVCQSSSSICFSCAFKAAEVRGHVDGALGGLSLSLNKRTCRYSVLSLSVCFSCAHKWPLSAFPSMTPNEKLFFSLSENHLAWNTLAWGYIVDGMIIHLSLMLASSLMNTLNRLQWRLSWMFLRHMSRDLHFIIRWSLMNTICFLLDYSYRL